MTGFMAEEALYIIPPPWLLLREGGKRERIYRASIGKPLVLL